MKMHSKALTKALAGVAAAGAIAASAAPAMAQDWGRYGGNGYRSGNERGAVNQCTRVAENAAHRRGYERANVTDITNVRGRYGHFEVRGRINVRDFDSRWGNRWDSHYGRDHDRWGNRGYRDSGSFICRVNRGRVTYLDINGVRGL